MKTSTITSLVALASFAALPVTGYRLQSVKRQVECSEIGYLFKLVNTALFSVNYVQNYYQTCDVSILPDLEAQGLNGPYALDLICLYDEGSLTFNESLSVVNDNLIVALVGLFDAASLNNDPSRNLSCAKLNTNILDELVLDSVAIKSIICDYSPCTTAASASNSVSSTPPASTSNVISSTLSTSRALASISGSGGAGGSSVISMPSITTGGSTGMIGSSTFASSMSVMTGASSGRVGSSMANSGSLPPTLPTLSAYYYRK